MVRTRCLRCKLIITVTFRDEPIVIMTSEEVADVARLGSDINSLAPPQKNDRFLKESVVFN